MKIDTSKITDNTAIHCPKKKYIEPVLKAMGRGDSDFVAHIKKWWYEGHTYVNFQNNWVYSKDKNSWESKGYTIIEFEDLIIPESNLANALGVQEDQPFRIKKHIGQFRVHNNQLEFRMRNDWSWGSHDYNVNALMNAEIKPLPKWTEEEQEMARKDSFRFKYISKDSDIEGKVILWETKPAFEDKQGVRKGNLGWLIINDSNYPSLKPGKCVALEEIAGGGE